MSGSPNDANASPSSAGEPSQAGPTASSSSSSQLPNTLAASDGAASQPVTTSSTGEHEQSNPTFSSLPASLQSPYSPLSRPPTPSRPFHVVLASTGSVASVKMPLIVESLLTYANVRIQIIATSSSLHFYDRETIARLNDTYSSDAEEEGYSVARLAEENRTASLGRAEVGGLPRVHLWTDADEWSSFHTIGDPILHIELRRWADIVLVAPTSANTLAKLNAGLCDDLLTSFMRALSRGTRTILYPAMNTLMWEHPLTEKHVEGVKGLGYEVRGPVEKVLACGDTGRGAMSEWSEVVRDVVEVGGLVKSGVGSG